MFAGDFRSERPYLTIYTSNQSAPIKAHLDYGLDTSILLSLDHRRYFPNDLRVNKPRDRDHFDSYFANPVTTAIQPLPVGQKTITPPHGHLAVREGELDVVFRAGVSTVEVYVANVQIDDPHYNAPWAVVGRNFLNHGRLTTDRSTNQISFQRMNFSPIRRR